MRNDNVAGLIVGLAILGVLLGLLLNALAAVFLMLGLALVHADAPAVPALGFFASFGLLIVASSIAWAVKGVQLDAKKS